MPESLWQAVQEETAKQERKQLQRPEARQSAVPSRAQKNANENVRKDIRKRERTSQPPEVRKSVSTSGRPIERLTERRPHDLYRDQILWVKETKLEIEKRYGQLVTANAMVQLALDLLIADYQRNKERSKLVLRLVSKEAWNRRTEVRKSERTYD